MANFINFKRRNKDHLCVIGTSKFNQFYLLNLLKRKIFNNIHLFKIGCYNLEVCANYMYRG